MNYQTQHLKELTSDTFPNGIEAVAVVLYDYMSCTFLWDTLAIIDIAQLWAQ